jgi:glycosyltransferase involved in cell wall biosynthesis
VSLDRDRANRADPAHLTFVREVFEDREFVNYLALEKLGVGVDVVVSRDRGGRYEGSGVGFPVTRLRRVSGVPVTERLRARVRTTLVERFDVDRLIGLESAIRDRRVVCVNETHLPTSAQVCRLRRRRTDLRVVTVCHENIPFRYDADPLAARRKDAVLESTDVFVALTPPGRDALVLEGVAPDRVLLQPLGVDAEKFHPCRRDPALRASWGVEPGEPVVMFVGRLLQEKGGAELLRAAAKIREERFQLVFVGSGSEELRLRRMVSALKLEDHVRFVPWASSAEIPRFVASADVFALPSLRTPYWEEQLGYALIEAMASGVPILSTSSPSIEYVVGDSGILVAAYDNDALADGLRLLVTDALRRSKLGAAGRARVEAELNTTAVAERYASLVATLQP